MIRPRAAALAPLLLLATGAVLASSGVVVDPKGDPIGKVKVCYRAGGVEQLCVETDEQGAWALPPSRIDTVRLSHRDYIPRIIDGSAQAEPLILQPGAVVLIRLADAAGKPLSAGEVDILRPSGQRFGPFPVAGEAGTRVNSLDPGPAVFIARAKGFVETRVDERELVAGETTEVSIRLERARDGH